VNGSLSDNFHLIKPVEFALPSGVVTANSFGYQVEFRGNWHAQFVKFDGTGGLYNWLRYKFIVVPGQSQVTIADFDPMGGDIIPQPPDRYLRFVKELQLGEINLQFLVLTGLRDSGDQIADLNDLIVSGDLDPILDNIESRMLISSSA